MLEEAEELQNQKKGKAAAKAGKENARRRKTEREEDAELLKEEVDEVENVDDAPFVFTQSPPCELSFLHNGRARD